MNQREQDLKSFCFEQADLYFSQEKNEPSFCWEFFWKYEVFNKYNSIVVSNLSESLKTGSGFTPIFLNDQEGSEDYLFVQSIKDSYFSDRNIRLVSFESLKKDIIEFISDKTNILSETIDDSLLYKLLQSEVIQTSKNPVYSHFNMSLRQFQYLYQRGSTFI